MMPYPEQPKREPEPTAPPLALLNALRNAMAEVDYVRKGGFNQGVGYKYASEGDAIRALRPIMLKWGLVLTPNLSEVSAENGNGNAFVVIEYTLWHTDSGESLKFRMPGCGNDRNRNGCGDKGVFKAITGAGKYALLKLFMVETGDDPERDNYLESGAEVEDPEPPPTPDPPAINPGVVASRLASAARAATSLDELTQLWSANQKNIMTIHKANPEEYGILCDAFSNRKKQLQQTGTDTSLDI